MRHARLACLLALTIAASPRATRAQAASTGVDAFESFRRATSLALEPLLVHVFGDDTLLERLDRLPEGEAIVIDPERQDRPLGLAWREGGNRIAALDEDGDMRPGDSRADSDSDCLLVDLHSDGVLDRGVDWIDLDRDGDADVQVLYEITPGALGAEGVGATIVFDLDDDDRFLHLTDYGYHSNRDMWESDFDGDGCFLAALRDEVSGRWSSAYENPFCFYDADGDGVSDEALRLEGRDLEIQSIRWSFDADGDAAARGGRDYDVSITAAGRVLAPAAFADSFAMRDGKAVRWVAWSRARDLARWGIWNAALMVWDEDDHNVAPQSDQPDRERWEGVIAEEVSGFPQVGGPSCGRLGKRYELDRDGSGRLGLYASGLDQRLHLSGAEGGELSVALGAPKSLTRVLRTEDRTGNGFFDTWIWEADRSGLRTRTAIVKDEEVRPVRLDLESIRSFARESLPRARERSKAEADQLTRSIRRSEANPILRFWDEGRERHDPLVVRAESSLEAERLLRDLALWELGGGVLARGSLESADRGVWRLDGPLPGGCPLEIAAGRLPGEAARTLQGGALPEVSAGSTRITGQVEDQDGDGGIDHLFFPAFPILAGAQVRLILEPAAPLPRREQVRVDRWLGQSVAFESIAIGYRTYGGRLDVLQKKSARLVLRTPLGDVHAPQFWGMDPLEVGEGPGLGGLYLERDGRWVPLFGSSRGSEVRVEAEGPLRARVRVALQEGGVHFDRIWTIVRGERHVEEELRIAAPGPVTLGAALTRLGTWGRWAGPPERPEGSPESLTVRPVVDGTIGIWSFGVSVPAAGAVGLAGVFRGARSAEAVEIDTNPALRFTAAARDTVLLFWMAGGAAYGDSTDAEWASRAAGISGTLERARALCH